MLRVLLVDIDAEARASLTVRIARMSDVQLVGAAADVPEAHDLIRVHHPDVVLVDVHRREDHRDEAVLNDIRRLTEAPLVVLASFLAPDRWDDLRAAGATALLLKHIDTDRFAEELRRAAGQHAAN